MDMKIKRIGCAALAALLVLANAFTVLGDAPEMPGDAATADADTGAADGAVNDGQSDDAADDTANSGQTPGAADDAANSGQTPGAADDVTADGQTDGMANTEPADGTQNGTANDNADGGQTNGMAGDEKTDEPSDGMTDNKTTNDKAPDKPSDDISGGKVPGDPSDDTPDDESEPDGDKDDVPQEPPAFSAHVEWTGGNGYVVRGTFTEFTDDIVNIRPMCSTNGEAYELCTDNLCWDLRWIGTDDPDRLRTLENQICLVSNVEPFKSYLAGTLDRFYIKLCITKENGKSYETKAAVIDRGTVQPLPEGIRATPRFDSSMTAGGWGRPRYGIYQITVGADATPEEIASYLPDTVPVEICLTDSKWTNFTEGVIDCPVTWKPVALPALVPGERVTIPDAAGELIVPAGTTLCTPLGVFRLDEACFFDDPYYLDDINLVLNVIAKDASPTGALSAEWDGLELAFNLKPTGASSIQAYTYKEGDAQWTKLPSPLSLDALNGQPKTANSGYAPVLGNDLEPYRSYLLQKESGNPAPFYVGIVIEGGVYDKKQLILAWPDNYDLPLALPKLGGSGGNENNAGSDDESDSTGTGQRPNLPEDPSGSPEGSSSTSPGTQSGQETPGAPEQSGTQSPGASKPGENGTSDAQSPGQPGPGKDASSHDRPKPVRPDGNDTDDAGDTTTDKGTEKTGAEKDSVSDTKASTTKHPVIHTKAGTAKNSAVGDKTRAPESPAADKGEHTPSAEIPAKKAGEGDTPALPGLLPDDGLHTDSREDLLLAQAGRSKDTPTNRRSRTDSPARTKESSQSPLLPAAAAVALFGICIAGAKKFPKK